MQRAKLVALISSPLLVLLVSYAAISARFGTLLPWHAVVHEDGRRTLAETVFYFEHALGELPLEWLLSAALAGAVLMYCGPPAASPRRRSLALAAMALAVDGAIVAGAWGALGWREAMIRLLQYRTREGAPAVFGSHWRYHLLSEATLMLEAAALAGLFWGRSGGRSRLWQASWIGFAALSLLFGIDSAPFFDPRYLGHQARETFTHALVTIPLALGVCCIFTGSPGAGPPPRQGARWVAAGCVLLGLYQGAGAILSGAANQAQTHDLLKLVCGHFFEHTFSYLVVGTHSLLFYSVLCAQKPNRSVVPSLSVRSNSTRTG